MSIPLEWYLLLSTFLFCVGFAGAVIRRNAILVLIGIELMLNAANLNLVAFWRYQADATAGVMFVLFAIGVAAAEAAVGLALVIAIYRHYQTTNVDRMDQLKG